MKINGENVESQMIQKCLECLSGRVEWEEADAWLTGTRGHWLCLNCKAKDRSSILEVPKGYVYTWKEEPA